VEAGKGAGEHPKPGAKIPEPVVGFIVAVGKGDRGNHQNEKKIEKEIVLSKQQNMPT
jgi:hypothetical protein